MDAALIRGQEVGDVSGEVWLAMIEALRDWIGERTVTWLAVEQMVIRPNMMVAAPALMHLQGITGAVAGAYGQVGKFCALKPEEWKGQLKKHQHHQRVLDKLSPHELEILGAIMDLHGYRRHLERGYELPEEHNLVDAIGIGCSRAVQYALLGDVEARSVAQKAKATPKTTSNGTKFLHWAPGVGKVPET